MKENNNLAQVRKWTVEIFLVLIIAFVIWLARGVNQLGAQVTTTHQLEDRVKKMENWIDDWYNVLRVPERDQKQDSQILEFRQRIERLEVWRDATKDE